MKPLATLPDSDAPDSLDIDAEAMAADLESKGASEALEWAFETFHPTLYIACSFQKTSSVVIDIATKIAPDARFFYLDTDVLFEETYETRDRLAEHYGIEFERYHNMTLEEQARRFGDELWKRDPDSCCGIRKVEPMREALSSVDAWVSGIRREDSQHRASAPKFAWDKRFGLWKLNPIADWTEERRLELHPASTTSPTTRCTTRTTPRSAAPTAPSRSAPGEDSRAGRWAGASKTECGIN